jgi:hypothetical protein
MKVIFVNTDIGYDTSLDYLTLNKTYEVEDVETFFSLELGQNVTLYNIITDNGKKLKKNAKVFITQEEIRNERLNELGI